MIDLDLTHAQEGAYRRALAGSGKVRIHVAVLDLAHQVIDGLDNEIMDGQVDVTGRGARAGSATFDDPRRLVSFGSNTGSGVALHADRMLQISYGTHVVEDGIGWVDVPVITGPIFGAHRAGGTTQIQVRGKESRAQTPAFRPFRVDRGVPKVEAIRRIMRFYTGETRFSFPDLKATLPKPVSLGRGTIPWDVVIRIAQSMNRQLYYDGAGVLRLRRLPNNPVWSFRDGPGGTVTGVPDLSFDIKRIRNVITVRNGKPRGSKGKQGHHRIERKAVAERSHDMSPWSLGVDEDHPYFLPKTVTNRHVRSAREAQELADQILADRLRLAVTHDYQTLVVPDLEGGDLVALDCEAGDVALEHRTGDFSVPLKVDQYMSMGSHKKVSVQKPRRKRPKSKAGQR